jgi:hypothetical protein
MTLSGKFRSGRKMKNFGQKPQIQKKRSEMREEDEMETKEILVKKISLLFRLTDDHKKDLLRMFSNEELELILIRTLIRLKRI